MGGPDSLAQDEPVMDEKARRSYEQRIRDLHAEIEETEEMNDLGRMEKLKAEMDQLTDHLTKALGMGRRTRKFNAPAERAAPPSPGAFAAPSKKSTPFTLL